MSAHTPGPWMQVGGSVYRDIRDKFPIADARGPDSVAALANARIMAAAPDMADALRIIECGPDAEMAEIARAALAKAGL